jgi:outer membrane usher protein
VDTWDTSIETLYDDGAGDLAIDGNLHYSGNRLTASLTHTASLDARAFGRRAEPLTDQRTTLQLGTAIAFADGHAAIGPPITGPGGFAIVAPHDSLSDNRIVLGSSKRPRAHTDAFGPAIVGALPSYRTSRLTYDVDGLPLGYDLGSRDFRLKAPYRGGYALTVRILLQHSAP